jgi:hypothetical protein
MPSNQSKTTVHRAVASGRIPPRPTAREIRGAFALYAIGARKRPDWAEHPTTSIRQSVADHPAHVSP